MKRTFTIDAETIEGNPWIESMTKGTNQVSYTTDSSKPGKFTIDTDGLAFYISQLAYLETKLYNRKYATITYLQDIPVVTGVPEHAQEWAYRSYDGVTVSKFIGASTKDLPKISAKASISKVNIGYAGNMLEWALEELRNSAFLGTPIDATQTALAFRSSQEHSQEVAYFGDEERGMNGLFNHPNVPKSAMSKDINAMSGQELFDVVNDLIYDIHNNSAMSHLADTVLVYPDFFKKMNSTLMTEYQNMTVMKFFKENNYYTQNSGQEITIQPRLQLSAANMAKAGVNNGGKARILAYEKNEENLGVVANMPYRLTAPQAVGLAIEVAGEYKCSGTEYRFPVSAKFVDAA
jgi:hypothetical protein